MKTFETVTGAFNYVRKNFQVGEELILNDALHFGISIPYVWSDMVGKFNLDGFVASPSAFTHIENDEQLERVISYLLQTDGYLALNESL